MKSFIYKSLFGLILFIIVFAGIALACVCYINPDGTDAWCEPADCNLKQSYCVGEGSTCGIEDDDGNIITCCSGLNCQRLVHGETKICVKPVTCGAVGQACCTNDACNLDTTYCSKQYYDANGVLKTVSPHCCEKGDYWDPSMNKCWDNQDCNYDCLVVFGTPWEKFFQNPSCVYKATSWLACCSAGSIYGSEESDYQAIIIY